MSEIWKFEEGLANAAEQPWQLQLRPDRPADGIAVRQASPTGWMLFGVRPLPHHELHLVEAYARDTDLVLRFEQSRADTFAFQLNYRWLSPALSVAAKPNDEAACPGIELWLSVQTDLLDSAPALSISSRSPAGEGWRTIAADELTSDQAVNSENAPGVVALTCKTEDCTGVWLMDPNDMLPVQILSQPDDEEQRLQLFGDFMEKGVIRRARMRFQLIAGDLTTPRLQTLRQQFAESPLPLTA